MSLEALYELVLTKANEIESQLKIMGCWSSEPLAREKLEEMGAFGSNTMAFEEWLQFILIPRIKQIVQEKGDFPGSSMIATYAIRVLGDDAESSALRNLLYELDELINYRDDHLEPEEKILMQEHQRHDHIEAGSSIIPPVVFTLAKLLSQYEGEHLESQLQTFDIFLNTLSPDVRPAISSMVKNAADQTSNEASKTRIKQAALSIEKVVWLHHPTI